MLFNDERITSNYPFAHAQKTIEIRKCLLGSSTVNLDLIDSNNDIIAFSGILVIPILIYHINIKIRLRRKNHN